MWKYKIGVVRKEGGRGQKLQGDDLEDLVRVRAKIFVPCIAASNASVVARVPCNRNFVLSVALHANTAAANSGAVAATRLVLWVVCDGGEIRPGS